MVWRTNFDQQQQFQQQQQQTEAFSRQQQQQQQLKQKSTTTSSSSSSSTSSLGSNSSSKTPTSDFVVHAAQSSSVNAQQQLMQQQRDQQSSPLTIPLNESVTMHAGDEVNIRELDPTTAAIMQATQSQKTNVPSRFNGAANVNKSVTNGKKSLPIYTSLPNGGANSTSTSSILKKPTTNGQISDANPNLSNFNYMFEQLIQQMEIISQV